MAMDIVIVAAARTAVGKFGGTLAKTPAAELGAAVIKELLKRSRPRGRPGQRGDPGPGAHRRRGQNPARQAVIKSGLPKAVPAMTINKVCGSGLKAVMLARRPSATATARS
jgi:acetyl-CoA C-acetyltransferase